jgi:hypothetical protein
LSIFICFPYSGYEVDEQADLDGAMRRHRKAPTSDVPEHDMTGPVVIMIDAHAPCDYLHIVNPPVARITPHLGD